MFTLCTSCAPACTQVTDLLLQFHKNINQKLVQTCPVNTTSGSEQIDFLRVLCSFLHLHTNCHDMITSVGIWSSWKKYPDIRTASEIREVDSLCCQTNTKEVICVIKFASGCAEAAHVTSVPSWTPDLVWLQIQTASYPQQTVCEAAGVPEKPSVPLSGLGWCQRPRHAWAASHDLSPAEIRLTELIMTHRV